MAKIGHFAKLMGFYLRSGCGRLNPRYTLAHNCILFGTPCKITFMSNHVRVKETSSSRKVASAGRAVRVVTLAASEIWHYKRENQRRDIAGLNSGALAHDDVNWFSGGVARNAKVIGSLF